MGVGRDRRFDLPGDFGDGGFPHILGEQWAIAADLKYSLTAGDSDQRIAFLKQFGWDVEEEPVEVTEVVIPETFNSVYEQYNEIQKQQGLDLSKFGGVTCKKWVYQVTNYPKPGRAFGLLYW